jgi:hypothetical protein
LEYSPYQNLEQVLKSLPEGHRLSALEEVKYAAQMAERLRAVGGNPRDVLRDPMFERFIAGNPYKWQHTGVILRPPQGARDFTRYTETDELGWKHSRTDVYFRDRDGEKKIAEGVLMPHKGNVRHSDVCVRTFNALGMPASVYLPDDTSEEAGQHTWHVWFNPNLDEIEVALDSAWNCKRNDTCLLFYANFRPSYPGDQMTAFRAFQGSMNDVIVPELSRSPRQAESMP